MLVFFVLEKVSGRHFSLSGRYEGQFTKTKTPENLLSNRKTLSSCCFFQRHSKHGDKSVCDFTIHHSKHIFHINTRCNTLTLHTISYRTCVSFHVWGWMKWSVERHIKTTINYCNDRIHTFKIKICNGEISLKSSNILWHLKGQSLKVMVCFEDRQSRKTRGQGKGKCFKVKKNILKTFQCFKMIYINCAVKKSTAQEWILIVFLLNSSINT